MPRYAFTIFSGALVAFYQNQLPDVYWSAWVPALLFFAWRCYRYRYLALFLAAWLWSSGVFHVHLEHRLKPEFDGRQLVVDGMVTDLVEVHDRRLRFEFEPDLLPGYTGRMPRRIRISWYQTRVIPQAGERWRFELKLRQPGGYLNPGGFDYQAWQFTRGIDGSATVRSSAANRRLSQASTGSLNAWRSRLAQRISKHCIDCTYQGLIQALVLGFRGQIEASHRDVLRNTGTAHLLAISGLHIGLVAGLGFVLGQFCWRLGLLRGGLARRQVASLIALAFALAYAALAGFSLPTLRALIMLTVLLLAFLYRQKVNLLNSLALAVSVLLFLDPRAAGSVSLWLSLSALLIIGFAQPRLLDVRGWWRQLIVLQVYFSLLMLPLGLFLFDQATPAGFIANLVAIPVISFLVLPLALLSSLLATLDLAAVQALFGLLDRILHGLLKYLGWLDESGLGAVQGQGLPVPLLICGALALLPWLLPASLALRRSAVVLAAILLSWQPQRLQHGEFNLVVLDVGMGTSIVLHTRSHSLIYDFGPGNRRGFSAAEWTLIPYLQSRRTDPVDLMIVSHVDQDHSGGFVSFKNEFDSVTILSGTPVELQARFSLQRRVDSCHDARPWSWDGVEFRFLSAIEDMTQSSTNNRSCVLLVQGYHRALLPGDIEIEQELRLIEAVNDGLDADILIAPHHGSDTSSDPRFLEQVSAEYVVFTVSRNNRWGFPHADVVERFARAGVHRFHSDRDGAVSFVSRSDRLLWHSSRSPPRRIWRRW